MRAPTLPWALLTVCTVLACGGPDDPVGADTDADTDSDTDTDTDTDSDSDTDTDTDTPIAITGEASVALNPFNPFSALVTVTLDHDATVAVHYADRSTPERRVLADEPTEIVVLGLFADTSYSFEVRATEGEASWSSTLDPITTEPLPEGWPACVPTFTADEASFDPEEILCTQDGTPSGQEFFFCTDHWGRPVFALGTPQQDVMMSARPLRDGGWAATSYNNSVVVFFDEKGEVLSRLAASYFASDTRFDHTFIDNHEMIEIQEGPWEGAVAFLTGSYENLAMDEYALGNGIIVYDPASGEVLYDYSFHGERGDQVAMDPKLPYSRTGIGDTDDDWTHANVLIHGIDDDGRDYLLVSLKAQDWLLKLYPDTDSIDWVFGFEGDFDLVDDLDASAPVSLPPLEFPYHQHGAVVLDKGDDRLHMLLFDNGYPRNDGTSVRWDLYYSRLLELTLDETTKRAQIDWQYGDRTWGADEHFFSTTCSNALLTEDGDRVIALDGEAKTMFEVSYPAGEELWRMSCPSTQWCQYRVSWFPSVYELDWAVR